MKKGIVALLIVLALIVLVSPGIVGRLAEQSIGENLDRAATEAQEVVVTSEGFQRGWFSSAGQHRVEIRRGELRDVLLAFTGAGNAGSLPALIIDTRLDHGLIPMTSMSREHGSLKPGLGSAVSTLRIELSNGDPINLPVTIYSNVGLSGQLLSNVILESGSFDHDDATASWGSADFLLGADPVDGDFSIKGELSSLNIQSKEGNVQIEGISIDGEQSPSPFGFAVGSAYLAVQSVSIDDADGTTMLGPLTIDTNASVDGGRASGHTTIELGKSTLGSLGTVGLMANVRIENADGQAVGNIKRALDNVQLDINAQDAYQMLEDDLQRLLASGLEVHIDQFDMSLPQGEVVSTFRFVVPETDRDDFTWTAVLLALEASANISVPEALVDLAIAMDPQFNAAIGMGFLRKKGDVYEVEAAYKKGLLTVNGAPMPIPLPGLQ